MVTVTGELPPGLDHLSSNAPDGTTCTVSDRVVTCQTAAPIPAFGSLVVEIRARVVAPAGTDLVNTATVQGGDAVDVQPMSHHDVLAAGTAMSDTVEVTVMGAGSLVRTGSDIGMLLSIAGMLLFLGVALSATRRPRPRPG